MQKAIKDILSIFLGIITFIWLFILYYDRKEFMLNIKEKGTNGYAIVKDSYYLKSQWKTEFVFFFKERQYDSYDSGPKKLKKGDTIAIRFLPESPEKGAVILNNSTIE